MITVHVENVDTCLGAIEWCSKHLSSKLWAVETRWPAAGYDFQFKDAQAATLFGLKWAGTV